MVLPLLSTASLHEGVTIQSASEAMLRAFDSTHSNFVRYTEENERSGTTATVAVLYDEYLLLR